jgi:FAD-dependent oxidoreductase domain-containing protein 1
MPAFEALRLKREWAGHYDECKLDADMILGNWPGKLDNFFVACGFFGHGLMHAPAVGRELAELMVKGRYETIDLTRMGFQRVLDNAPYAETGII